ncbi:MAG TPA: hypothetical protein VIT88_00575 [Pyrinomonadaceae bacterium]
MPSQPNKQPAPASQNASVITAILRTNLMGENSFIGAEFIELVVSLSSMSPAHMVLAWAIVSLAIRENLRIVTFLLHFQARAA